MLYGEDKSLHIYGGPRFVRAGKGDDKMSDKLWTMPDWMERYRKYIEGIPSPISTEECMNADTPSLYENEALAWRAISAKSKVALLEWMHTDSLI